jgi:hypothetical protein
MPPLTRTLHKVIHVAGYGFAVRKMGKTWSVTDCKYCISSFNLKPQSVVIVKVSRRRDTSPLSSCQGTLCGSFTLHDPYFQTRLGAWFANTMSNMEQQRFVIPCLTLLNQTNYTSIPTTCILDKHSSLEVTCHENGTLVPVLATCPFPPTVRKCDASQSKF